MEMIKLLSNADRSLGRLDGITQILPNPELFVAMYVQKEAVLSAQIEGTQASLIDVIDSDNVSEKRKDVAEIVRYVAAMRYRCAIVSECLKKSHRLLINKINSNNL